MLLLKLKLTIYFRFACVYFDIIYVSYILYGQSGYKQFQLLDTNVNSIRVKNQKHSELTVLAAEAAFATGNTETARKLVEEFLLKSPQHDQFYCRAKITLALLIDHEACGTYGESSIVQRKLALQELLTALDVAISPENKSRYEFIVFNVSVECWRIIRQFLRSNRARFFTDEILRLVQALEGVTNVDKDWLITFYTGVSYCLQDSDNGKTASEVLDKAILVAQDAVSTLAGIEEAKVAETHRLAHDIENLQRAMHSAEEREQRAKSHSGESEYHDEEGGSEEGPSLQHLYEQLVQMQLQLSTIKDECKALSEKKLPLVDRVNRLYMQRIYALPTDAKRFAALPEVTQNLRTRCLCHLHCMQAGCTPATEWESTFRTILTEINAAPPSPSSAETLFDASRIARSLGGSRDGGILRELSQQLATAGQDMVRSQNILTAMLLVKQDLCNALQMVDSASNTASVLSSGDDGSGGSATKPLLTEQQVSGFAISNRLEALKLLERVLSVSQNRVKDASLIQEVCVETWNALYPLIQSHLRKKVHRPIQLISAALQDIDSPLLSLRAHIYYELCKCEEEIDYVVKAHTEAVNGLSLDYGTLTNVTGHFQVKTTPATAAAASGKAPKTETTAPEKAARKYPMPPRTENPGYDSDRPLDVLLNPLADVLFLRSSLYSTPDSTEEQVITNLQQIRESSSKKYKKEMLSKSSHMMFDALVDEEDNVLYQQVHQHTTASALSAPLSVTSVATRKSTADGKSSIKPIPLDVFNVVLDGLTAAPGASRVFQDLQKKTQQRINIMTSIAQFGHVSQADVYRAGNGGMGGYSSRKDDDYKAELCHIVEKSLLYVLSHSWKPKDVMVDKLLIGQVNAYCMLAESIINRMDTLSVLDDDFIIVHPRSAAGIPPPEDAVQLGDDEPPPTGSVIVDPRAMGIKGKLSGVDAPSSALSGSTAGDIRGTEEDGVVDNEATTEMMNIKRMVLKLLDRALYLATEALDITAVQNVIIYFWNINIHVFRKNLYHLIMPECIHFLERAAESLELVSAESDRRILASGKGGTEIGLHPVVDRKLQMSIIEALATALVATGEMSRALEVALTGCKNGPPDAPNNPSVYVRKRLCELVCHLSVVSAGGGSAGTAGGKGKSVAKGSGASADAPIPVFDHPLLNVMGLLVVVEIYGSAVHAEDTSKTGAIPGLIDKATALMNGEVVAAVETFNNRVNAENARIPLTQEEYDQFQELLVSCWARLTRANLKVGNIYATNEAAVECMQIVSRGISNPQPGATGAQHDATEISGRVNKRVWRWASLCERFMGLSISRIIRDEGQEKELQNQLRLASLRHFSLSCQFGQNAEIDALILAPAIDAWNVSIALVDDVCASRKGMKSSVHTSLVTLQKQIISALLFCKVEEPDDDEEEGTDPEDSSDKTSLVKLKFYLSIIEEFAQSEEWKQAMEVVMDAFENVPSGMQKPLWKWRVIVMSKLGKSVLDGMQKLKENDPALQARVYAILARSASKKRHQLEAYRKTVEILKDDITRVEYLLETAQWMGAVGLPKAAAMEVILGAVDALYEIEEQMLEEKDDVRDGMSESSRATTRTGKSSGSRKSGVSSAAKSRVITRRGSSLLKRSTSRGSTKSEKSESAVDSSRLNILQLDQAMRAIAMVAILENSSECKLERCVEGAFFLDRALSLWQGEINKHVTEIVRKYAEDSASVATDQSSTGAASRMSQEQLSKLVEAGNIPTDPVDLALWTPSKEFYMHMAKVTERTPLLVPSKASLPSLQLSVYYMMAMSSVLEKNGHTKSALFCLAWIRVCVLFGCNMDNPEPLLAVLHFKILSILSSSNVIMRKGNQAESDGAPSVVISMTTHLGNSDLTSVEYLTSIIPSTPAPESAFQASPEPVPVFNDDTSLTADTKASTTSGRVRSRSSRSRGNRPVTSSGQANPYDIKTWTQEMTSDVEALFCYIDLCRCMVDMGLFGKARKYAKFVIMESKGACNTRAHAMACTLLAEIELARGNIADAVSIIIESRGSIESTGDAELLGRHAQILIKCYMGATNAPEAHRVAEQAFDVLLRATVTPLVAGGVETRDTHNWTSEALLETVRGTSSTVLRNISLTTPGVNVSSTVSEVSPVKEGGTRSATLTEGQVKNLPPFEFRYDAAEAYLQVAFSYVDFVLVPERMTMLKTPPKKTKNSAANDTLHSYDTPLGHMNGSSCGFLDMSRMEDIFGRCDLLATSVDGPRSPLRAEVLHKSGMISFHMLRTFHQCYSKEAGTDRDLYMAWIDASLSSAVQRLEEALDIYTGLNTRVPVVERSYVPPERAGHRIELASSLSRMVSKVAMDLCEVLLHLHILRSTFIPPPVPGDPSGKLSVVEKYLEQCRPTTATRSKIDLKSFQASALDKAMLLSSTTSQSLRSTEEGLEATIMFAAAGLAARIEAGEAHSSLCIRWHRKLDLGDGNEIKPNGSSDDVPVTPVTGDSELQRQASRKFDEKAMLTLEELVWDTLRKSQGVRYQRGLTMGAYYLLEACGKSNHAATASFLFTYQNLVVRGWLLDLWRTVLTSTSEIAASLHRIDTLQSSNISHQTQIQQRLDVEYAFLHASSIVWRRLHIQTDPKTVLESPSFGPGTCVLSLQFCPLKKFLFAAAGFPKSPPPSSSSGDSEYDSARASPGAWYVDKVSFR